MPVPRRRMRRHLTRHSDRGSRDCVVSVAGLVGRPVRNPAGEVVGQVSDVVARWDTGASHPPLAGLVARLGSRRAFIPAELLAEVRSERVTLTTARLTLREFAQREGEVCLARDILDRQLVDVAGVRVVRAADLYLAGVAGRVRLVGVDVGLATLLRRLGPARWRARANPDVVIDWASVHSFGSAVVTESSRRVAIRLDRHRGELNRLLPGDLATLLEDLGRQERRELLDVVEPAAAADALESMHPDKQRQLLTETGPPRAADLVALMEPDEAARALRGLSRQLRDRLLAAMFDEQADALRSVMAFGPDTAGGVMNTALVIASVADTVEHVRILLRVKRHVADLDAVVVVDEHGHLVDDVSLEELLLAEVTTPLRELVGPPWPVWVTPHIPIRLVADRMLDAHRLSAVVVDDQLRPIGRILADDVLQALLPGLGPLRLPRPRWPV
ncbi:MAG: magnesium transporter MgtE N-terminal domain-containing protein [Pseudonocardiaceae bacterium]